MSYLKDLIISQKKIMRAIKKDYNAAIEYLANELEIKTTQIKIQLKKQRL